jgi:hypothetical protein
MTTHYFLAPNARWQGRNLVGNAAIAGKLYTYRAGTSTLKTTYSDSGGVNPNANPVVLDGKGEANIYWAYDPNSPVLYKIELYDKDGNLVYTQDNYPVTDATNVDPTPTPTNTKNFVRNPQFTYATNSASFPSFTQSQNVNDFLLDDWLFFRSNTTATPINISQQLFTLGQTLVPANPIGYLHYECGDATSAGETYKRFQQYYKSAQTLSGQTIVVKFLAKSSTGSTMTASVIQNFGTGGSPSASVETVVVTANLTSTWASYTNSVTIPSVSGKTLGTNGDDTASLCLNMPLNTFASNIDICNVQLEVAATATDFPVESQEQQFLRLKDRIEFGIFNTGDFKITLRATADPGWAMCDDSTLGNSVSGAGKAYIATKALFTLIWNNFANTYAPIFNSDGTVGTRGSTAEADYNANKRLTLTKTVGRVLATAGQASLTETFTAFASQTFTRSSNQLVVADASALYTGTPIRLTTTGTLPNPLAPGTTYYAIKIDATHIEVAANLVDASLGNGIALTTAGTGTHTLYNAGQLVIADSSSFYTGTPVTLTTTGTLPAPLAISTTYYVINFDATHIELATTLANAVLGIPIPITDAGSGTQTIAINYTNWAPGQFSGEYMHALVAAELPNVKIRINSGQAQNIDGAPDYYLAGSADGGPGTPLGMYTATAPDTYININTFAGGNTVHNNMQPTTFVYTMLKL